MIFPGLTACFDSCHVGMGYRNLTAKSGVQPNVFQLLAGRCVGVKTFGDRRSALRRNVGQLFRPDRLFLDNQRFAVGIEFIGQRTIL